MPEMTGFAAPSREADDGDRTRDLRLGKPREALSGPAGTGRERQANLPVCSAFIPEASGGTQRTEKEGSDRACVFPASAITPRQQHLIGVLRRADEPWLELWDLAARAGYTVKIAAANVRELRRRQLVVTRPRWHGLSATEVSLRGPR